MKTIKRILDDNGLTYADVAREVFAMALMAAIMFNVTLLFMAAM
jgi:hypothetical protein